MKKHAVSLSIPVLLFYAMSVQAAPNWYSTGLDDRAVNCIIANDTGTIIAGTDSGVSVGCNKTWYHIKMLPVMALVRVSSSAVAAAAGNGSKSDGVYIGKNIINGPPFYAFTLGDYFDEPTALAVGPAVSATDPPSVLYVGNANTIAWGVVNKDSLSKLSPIGMPEYAFGVEQPCCAALHIFGNRLYAGGYDRSPMPGSSYLEYRSGDSMYPMRRMKTTAIAEGRFASLFGSSFLVMVVADADSGIFFYDQSLGNPWRRINGPPGAPGSANAPVRSLYVRQTSGSVNDNTLYAANKDGVFQCMPGEPQPFWTKLGTLPADPRYITGMGSTGDLLAATSKGVYRYGVQASGVRNTHRGTAEKSVSDKRRLTIAAAGKRYAGKACFDLRGRVNKYPQVNGVFIGNDKSIGH